MLSRSYRGRAPSPHSKCCPAATAVGLVMGLYRLSRGLHGQSGHCLVQAASWLPWAALTSVVPTGPRLRRAVLSLASTGWPTASTGDLVTARYRQSRGYRGRLRHAEYRLPCGYGGWPSNHWPAATAGGPVTSRVWSVRWLPGANPSSDCTCWPAATAGSAVTASYRLSRSDGGRPRHRRAQAVPWLAHTAPSPPGRLSLIS